MKPIPWAVAALVILTSALMLPRAAQGERHEIDSKKSLITIRVYKSGLFSLFAHNHQITTPILRGSIEDSVNPSVELWVDASQLRVVDAGISKSETSDVQKTMDGPDVLEVRRFPEIHFRSTLVQRKSGDHWMVRGDLELHGKAHSVDVDVAKKDGNYIGTAALAQTNFGISPVRIAGGTVKVKDLVKVEFEIAIVQ
jgi:polyisoprenoid-binding protein YceI